jgi:hypothetical protein
VDLCVGNSEDLVRLPKVKAWIDANNPGDPLIPFSVALEERLSLMSPEDKKAAEKEAAPGALGKITQAGYSSLEVSVFASYVLVQSYQTCATVDSVLHLWTGRGARMDYKEGNQSTTGRWRYSVCSRPFLSSS